jgi:N-methylhydantoinase A
VADAPFVIGVDTGGTFVDCVVVDAKGRAVAEKALAAPDAPLQAVLSVLEQAAVTLGLSVSDLLAATSGLVHGTTVGLNTLVTRAGSQVGLLTTCGHEDALLIGRVHQKVAGLSWDQVTRVAELNKPAPLVPRWRIKGIHERIDTEGAVVVRLDEPGVLEAAADLVQQGCDALAICFLWSFKNPAHEHRARDLIARAHPDIPVDISSEVAPVMGEYERCASTVVNAYISAPLRGYFEGLAEQLRAWGLRSEPLIMLSSGGVQPLRAALRRCVETLGSGPAGGVSAVQRLGVSVGQHNLVATDVGGTSFDVGLVVGGEPKLARAAVVERLHLSVPALDIQSIGAGGGSIARVDELGRLLVGPQSTGARPGPACYGQGGTQPTVTDADLLLGRLNPVALIGGRLKLDRAAAERAVGELASRLGLDVDASAAGIVRVADAKMADLIRKIMIEGGHDPRQAVLVAYGGAAALHVGAYAPDAGVPEAVVPRLAPVYSAWGLATARYKAVHARSDLVRMPADPGLIGAIFSELERAARSEAVAAGVDAGLELARTVDLRFRRQTHELPVSLGSEHIDEQALGDLCDHFEHLYESVFGPGTAYRQAGVEASTFRVTATAPRVMLQPEPAPAAELAAIGYRPVFFREWVERTPVYDVERLPAGMAIAGPAVIDGPATTLVVHPGQNVRVDQALNVHLAFA